MNYTPEYLSGVMSLRKPQSASVGMLADLLEQVPLRKGIDLAETLRKVHVLCHTCTDFEREFPSFTFALATGVGKTRLMGAFIAHLFTCHGVRNFFVVAPNTTIYEKLKRDLGEPGTPKYVFQGLGCFANPPQLVADDDYRNRQLSLFDSEVRIFIYNIDKFNKDDARMKADNEFTGSSFYQYLAGLDDLVLIMDESHHYRAEKGAKALNQLRPVLGLELTATPLVTKGNTQVPFKNVVYEYPLSQAIADGYTRTPFAITRSDIDFYNFGDEQLDKLMLQDGIASHERTKRRLADYAANHGRPLVKPFLLVVCKDTDHATWVENYIRSKDFRGGAYRDKTIIVHSKQKGSETEANTRLLLEVESPTNPVEIVIHVNMLKEGWDVNNLYTIVPLRTAASKVLREQMVGRGLRLPYGERTGDREVDAVMLTAHDKFKDILAEAQKGDSIFKAGNVIHAEELEEPDTTVLTQPYLPQEETNVVEAYEYTSLPSSPSLTTFFDRASDNIYEAVVEAFNEQPEKSTSDPPVERIAAKVQKAFAEDADLGETFLHNEFELADWLRHKTQTTFRAVQRKFIPIPRLKVTDVGVEEYVFVDFDLDLTEFTQVPIRNEVLLQNLEDLSDLQRIKGEAIDFEGYNPKHILLDELRKKPEVDYERCRALLSRLLDQLCGHFEKQFGSNGLRNIVMMYRRNLAEQVYRQMLRHFYVENGWLQEEVVGLRESNFPQRITRPYQVGLYEEFSQDIRKVMFTGIKKGVFATVALDSREGELTLARVLENDPAVLNWLRPSEKEFNITYNRGHRYIPDFVVETAEVIYLVEVKGEDKLNAPEVLAKKQRAIQYCAVATRWGQANGYKAWRYLFIPAGQILPSSSFLQLAKRFAEL